MSICVRYKNNEEDAKALVNAGFLKIVTNLHKYREEVPFEAWVRRIMLNTVFDDFRKWKKEDEHMRYTDFEENNYEALYSENNKALEQMDLDSLNRLLHKLPPVSREVFNLYAIDGYSHKEIGEMLGISEGTSKWHVSTARKALKKMLYKALNMVKTLLLL